MDSFISNKFEPKPNGTLLNTKQWMNGSPSVLTHTSLLWWMSFRALNVHEWKPWCSCGSRQPKNGCHMRWQWKQRLSLRPRVLLPTSPWDLVKMVKHLFQISSSKKMTWSSRRNCDRLIDSLNDGQFMVNWWHLNNFVGYWKPQLPSLSGTAHHGAGLVQGSVDLSSMCHPSPVLRQGGPGSRCCELAFAFANGRCSWSFWGKRCDQSSWT